MLQIGQRKRGREIGRHGGGERCLYEWSPCCVCGKERWVIIHKGEVKSDRCKRCSDQEKVKRFHNPGSENQNWKGGVHYDNGYRSIWISDDDLFCSMRRGGSRYIAEHRYIMAKHLGRLLRTDEVVHHKNGIRDDNRIENLELNFKGGHSKQHSQGYIEGFARGYVDGLRKGEEEIGKQRENHIN